MADVQRWLDEIHAEPRAVQALAHARAKEWMALWGGAFDPVEFIGHTAAYLAVARRDLRAMRRLERSERLTICAELRAPAQ